MTKNSVGKNFNEIEAKRQSAVSKKRTIIFSALWLVGILLLLLALSDFFTQNPFRKEYTAIYILAVAGSLFVARLWSVRMKQARDKNANKR